MDESGKYRPSGCRAVMGVVSICVGVALFVAMFPHGIIPSAVFIGGGARLLWSIGSL